MLRRQEHQDDGSERPRLRLVGGTQTGLNRPLPGLSAAQSDRVRALCDIAADANVACFDDPAPGFAEALAREVGVEGAQLAWVYLAAMLRDVGKLRVSRGVLFGLRPITEIQRHFLQMHALFSQEICDELGLDPEVGRAVRSHHENWDGSGFPEGMSGEAIPLGARIIGVADAYDGMTRSRLGRAGLSEAKALRELRRWAWHRWDPALVEAWSDVVESGRLRA